jgi:ATP-dependent DNA helicase DinG
VTDSSKRVRDALAAAVEAIDGSPRDGQIEMAEAVANAITDGHHLLVQAGTGTGKSLAYLIPPIVLNKKVLVATATLALQRQLVERDLPRVIPALEKSLDRSISYAIYKGIGNYLCLQKMNGSAEDTDDEMLVGMATLEKESKALRDWARKPGVSGDRDDAPEVDRKVWAANSVTGRECVGADNCPVGSECFSVKAKAKAQTADIVITNHTLLAIEIVDSHAILPKRDVVILDEAHEFLDRTTQAVTEELSAPRISRAASMAAKYLPGKIATAFTKAARDFEESLEDFDDLARHDASLRGRLADLPDVLVAPLRRVRETAKAVGDAIAADSLDIDPERVANRARVRGAINEIIQTTQKLNRLSPGEVLWFEPTFKTLHLAPLDVSDVVRENLLRRTPVIATSATLAVGRHFDSIAKNIGFVVDAEGDAEEMNSDEFDPSNVQMLDVGSPFDFASQGVLYLPKDLPEPSREGVNTAVYEELVELITAAGGRTLALFSSWRALEAADEYLRKNLSHLPIKIISQRRGDAVGALVEKFAEDETSVLLGTISLWQGVDVPGRSCLLVAIDRIPFPRPDEPIMSARSAAAEAAGKSGFMDVSLPRAALLLAQGTGRLIRSVDDRGVVAILDSRITTKRYGSLLLNSMPNFWRTSDRETVLGALRRLAEEQGTFS